MTNNRFPNEHLLVSTDWLADHLDDPDLRIVEVTPPGAGYVFSHIPGAVYLDMDEVLTGGVSGVERTVGPLEEVSAVLGRLGLTPAKNILVYDEIGGTRAAQAFWLLEYLGCDQVYLLEGGAERWLVEGRATTRAQPIIEPETFVPNVHADRLATANWIVDHMESDNVFLLDTRTAQEYAEGHIPGAHNRSWDETLIQRVHREFRAPDELRSDLVELGATDDKEIVAYCGTGARAAHTYLTLRLLGYDQVRNYDGSWTEWKARHDLPQA